MKGKCVTVQVLDSSKVWGLFKILMTENFLQNQSYKMQKNTVNSPESPNSNSSFVRSINHL